jgi:hypothetical protein
VETGGGLIKDVQDPTNFEDRAHACARPTYCGLDRDCKLMIPWAIVRAEQVQSRACSQRADHLCCAKTRVLRIEAVAGLG